MWTGGNFLSLTFAGEISDGENDSPRRGVAPDLAWTDINTDAKLYYYVGNSNLKSPTITSRFRIYVLYIMNNDEAIINEG